MPEANSKYCMLFCLGILINSTILAGNTKFLGNLTFFIAYSVGNNSQWLLYHRASTHGWATETFRDRCDNKSHTVIIIKNGQFVFGGYNDVPWGKYNFPETKKQLCSYFDVFALLSLLTVSVIVIAFSYYFLFFFYFYTPLKIVSLSFNWSENFHETKKQPAALSILSLSMGVHVSGTNIDDVIILWEIFFNVDIHSTHSATSKKKKTTSSICLDFNIL